MDVHIEVDVDESGSVGIFQQEYGFIIDIRLVFVSQDPRVFFVRSVHSVYLEGLGRTSLLSGLFDFLHDFPVELFIEGEVGNDQHKLVLLDDASLQILPVQLRDFLHSSIKLPLLLVLLLRALFWVCRFVN